MLRLHNLALLALTSAVTTQLCWAQHSTIPVLPVDGPPQAMHLDLATGSITPAATRAETPVSDSFKTSTDTGFSAIPPAGTQWIDWGVKACGLSGAVCEFVVGYSTTALATGAGGPGASLNVSFFSGTLGSCDPKVLAKKYVLNGLPGSPDGVTVSAFVLTVNVAADGFFLPDGPIGWGYAATDGLTGPLLMSAPDAGAGTVDKYDQYAPDSTGVCAGTFSFGTPGTSSFWMEITEDDGSVLASIAARTSTLCTNGWALVPAGPLPKIGGSLVVDLASFPISPGTEISAIGPPADSPCLPLSTFASSPLLIGIAAPFPLLVSTPGAAVGPPISLPIPPDCSLIGITLSIQSGAVDFPPFGFLLTDTAVDFTFGL
jgi:hypothetical protein